RVRSRKPLATARKPRFSAHSSNTWGLRPRNGGGKRSPCNRSMHREKAVMSQIESFEVVILGSGQGGKLLAWHLGRTAKEVAVVERRWVGGSCPAVACLPSKNELWSAQVAHVVQTAAHFGTPVGPATTDMRKVRSRKQDMIDREIAFHLNAYKE